MRQHRSRAVVIGLVALALLLSTTAAMSAKTVITHFAYTSHGESYIAFVNEAKARFEAINPDLEIQIVSGNYDKAMALVAGGVPADVLDLSSNLAPGWYDKGLLADLTPFLQKDASFSNTDYVPVSMLGYSASGTVFGLPMSTFQIMTFYNKDLLAQAGVPNPNALGDNWNWEALADMGKKLTRDRDGDGSLDQWGVTASESIYRWPIWVHQAGGLIFDKVTAPTKATFNTPAGRKGLEFLVSLFREHNIVAYEGDYVLWKSGGMFQNGLVGLTTDTGPSTLGTLAKVAEGKFDWDVVELPKGPDNNGTMVIMNGFQLSSSSRNPDLAWKWLSFLVSRESTRDFMAKTGRTPARISLLPEFIGSLAYRPDHVQVVSDALLNPASVPNYITPIYSQLSSFSAARVKEAIKGIKSATQALEEMDMEAANLFAR